MAELVYPTNEFLYFQNDLANVVEHGAGFVSIDWKPAPMRTHELREVYDQALELLQTTGFGRILTDHQLMAPIMPIDQEWLVHDWVPRATALAGYRRCAIVRSYDPLTRQATQQIVVQLSNVPLEVCYFVNRDSAASWILTPHGGAGQSQSGS